MIDRGDDVTLLANAVRQSATSTTLTSLRVVNNSRVTPADDREVLINRNQSISIQKGSEYKLYIGDSDLQVDVLQKLIVYFAFLK